MYVSVNTSHDTYADLLCETEMLSADFSN